MTASDGRDPANEQANATVTYARAQANHVDSFRDLHTYQAAKELADRMFQVAQTFPRDEIFSLTDQICRSSRSIGAQIAEAWGKRSYERSFVAKLVDANAEQMETQHWLDVALSCGYVSKATYDELTEVCERIGRMLWRMIEKSATFCQPRSGLVRETGIAYLADAQLESPDP